jgi:hypothetical protein
VGGTEVETRDQNGVAALKLPAGQGPLSLALPSLVPMLVPVLDRLEQARTVNKPRMQAIR